MVSPVTKLAASEARNTTTLGTSSGEPILPSGGAADPVVPHVALPEEALGDRASDVAGRHRVHPDPVGSPFGCEGLRKHDHARLGHVVADLGLRAVDDDPGHRSDVDDG